MQATRFKKDYWLYLLPLIVSTLEYFYLNHNNIPPSYPVIPNSIEREYAFSVMNGASFTGIVSMFLGFPLDILSLYLGVPQTITSTIGSFITFEILFLGVFFSSKYFLKKYFNASGLLLYLVPTLVSIPVPITWYTISGASYSFPGVYALTLALLDYSLDVNNKQGLKQILIRAMIASIAVTLDFTDPRGIVFGILTFFIYSLYFLIIKRGKRLFYLKEWSKIFIFGILFFLLLNSNTIVYTEFIKSYIPLVDVSTVYNQLGIALQHVRPFYTLSGVMYWLGANYYISHYHASLLLGVISTSIALIALLIRKPVSILFGVIVLAVVTYNYVGATTLGYYLAQTPYVGYLVYLYPTYLPSYFFVAPFYLLVSFTLYMISKYLYKGRHKVLSVLRTVPILLLLISPFIIFYSPLASAMETAHSIPPPPAVTESIKLISYNDSGIILVLGNSTLANFYSSLPSMLSPDFYGYINFIWNGLHDAKNVARFLSYFGIQYIVILQPNDVKCFDLFLHNNELTLIYNKSGVLVFENKLYKGFIIQKGVYIAFNFPQIVSQLSELNSTYVIIPFYYVDNLYSLLPYTKGFIGYNISPTDLIPMLVSNSSYIITASQIYLNQYYNHGWVHESPFWTPDIMNSIGEGNRIPLPLNLTLNIPNGEYYIFVLPVGYTYNEPQVSGSIQISSGNSLTVPISNSVYNVSWILAGKLDLINHEINIKASELGIVKIVFVPTSDYNNLLQEAKAIIKSREEISFMNNSVIIKPDTYSPSVYGISVFTNPWFEDLPYAHVAYVKNYYYHTQYYFGTAEIYITESDKDINTSYPSFLPELLLNFVIDIAVIFYIFYNRNLIQ
ncbi:hypothetical protein [Sulfurisphaera ohwakuensis]|uniref:hypothetical protein n=1 Tax=Sulfurisphaera ohwakuensis TaxID=69656 RepID=UPI0036F26042